jgi:hypothetical protein
MSALDCGPGPDPGDYTRNSVAVMARQIDTADHTTANVRQIDSLTKEGCAFGHQLKWDAV